MKSESLIIIKLGGSVVTHKNNLTPKARVEVIKNLAKEIKEVLDLGYKLILVHGAGSFGHTLTKKYNLHLGMKTDKQILAFGQVTRQMSRLNSIIIQYLLGANIKAVGIVPHTFIAQPRGRLEDVNLEIIKTYLANNQVPVLFGGLLLDDKRGCSVLSGDTIVCYLGKKLKAQRVIFLSDVDGVFDSDPKTNHKAKLIPKITNKNLNQVFKGLSSTNKVDVTGEMAGKIVQIKENLKNLPVYIISGFKQQGLIQLVKTNQVGTLLRLH